MDDAIQKTWKCPFCQHSTDNELRAIKHIKDCIKNVTHQRAEQERAMQKRTIVAANDLLRDGVAIVREGKLRFSDDLRS